MKLVLEMDSYCKKSLNNINFVSLLLRHRQFLLRSSVHDKRKGWNLLEDMLGGDNARSVNSNLCLFHRNAGTSDVRNRRFIISRWNYGYVKVCG